MAFNFRLNVQQVFRRLGIQSGARLPKLDDNIQMVMVLTDLSKLVPAPIEPRGLAGVNITPAVANFSTCQIKSLAAGGIFIESIVFRSGAFTSSENYLIDVTLTDLGMPVSPGNINVGGTQILSRFTAGTVPVSTGGASLPATEGRQGVELDAGIFVPNQSFFSVTTDTKNKRLDIAIIYRELPSVEEVG